VYVLYLLQAAMEKAGVLDDCDACDDCMEAAAKLSPEDIARLPLPGESGEGLRDG
jgi:hypothetical protein